MFDEAGVSYDDFVRTTEDRHKNVVEQFWVSKVSGMMFSVHSVHSLVNIHHTWDRKIPRKLHATSVLSFPNANKKVYFNPYIYAKATYNPQKVEKINVNFWSHDRCLSLENICHSFLMHHLGQMPWECKYLSL